MPAPTFRGRRRRRQRGYAAAPAQEQRPAGTAATLLLVVAIAWLTLVPAQQRADADPLPAAEPGGATMPAPAAGEAAAAATPAIVDIFAVRTWEPPPPPVVAPPPAPSEPPPPPPLPFTFLGRIAEAGKGTAYLLSERGTVRVVRVGDRLASGYLVEDYKDGQLVFLYPPMNIRQTLEIGDRP